MTATPLSHKVHAVAMQMYDGAGPAPTIQQFEHLDRGAAEVEAGPEVEVEPGWDAAAFDAVPAEYRDAVVAGTAAAIGRGVLHLEAEREMLRPDDIHVHVTDPARFVNVDGRVDRDAIRLAVQRVVTDRPELGRYGTGAGQERARPDDRRRADPADHLGAGVAASSGTELDRMRALMSQPR